jgi:D-galactose 1-dehydrogenase
MTTLIGIVGVGKIARDQHVPALAANDSFELVACASPHSKIEGLPSYPDIESMLQAMPKIAAVALCTTPQVRYQAAHYALQQRRHVLLEKPPGSTVSEVLQLIELARRQQVALLASWHSRHARCVEPARAWLAERTVTSIAVTWKEDVRYWHPGQTWIWRAGGLGVFDPAINALSIVTRIVPGSLALKQAELSFPSNCETPIAGQLAFVTADGAPLRMELDFLHPGAPSWDIAVDTTTGRLELHRGGSEMRVDGRAVQPPPSEEYPELYLHFARLIAERAIDVDLSPLQLVADAFLCGRRIELAPFVE